MFALPIWAKVLILAAIAAAVVAWDSARINAAEKRGADKVRAEYQANEIKAVKAAREEEARRTAAVQQEADHARQSIARAQADAAAAADAGQRLRAALTAARRSCAASPSATVASGSAPADTSADLLADVQRRLDEAADGIARHADAASIAGNACQRAYQALTP
jgi:predicted  nucleic acid-binding Zn-ribbon protein